MTGSSVERITWRGAPAWRKGQERIHHVSGRYFSLVVLSIKGREHLFIDQPEVGILGFLMTVHEGEPHWLVQAKAEPGNVGLTQWAPTVQATKSNYERVHGGRETPHLEAFRHVDARDVRGSEQGDRFLNKFNRNALRPVPASRMQDASDTTLTWTSSTDFKGALLRDYEVNTDARSVVVCANWDAHVPHGRSPFEGAPWRSSHARAFGRSWFDVSQQRVDAALEVFRSNSKPSLL
jgi:NDP-hexose 2,3-dehydratase.